MQTQGNVWRYAKEHKKELQKEPRKISVTIVFQGTSLTGQIKHRKKKKRKNVISRIRDSKGLKKAHL